MNQRLKNIIPIALLLSIFLVVLTAGSIAPTSISTNTSNNPMTPNSDTLTAPDIDPCAKVLSAPVQYVEANGVKFGYREFGTENTEPLVILKGYDGQMDTWTDAFIMPLAEKFHVYTYDHRGIGYSTDNGEQYEFGQLADDCVAFMKALGYEKFNVAGHSMGSFVVEILLTDYPQNVSHAVLISTLPSISHPAALKFKVLMTLQNMFSGITGDSGVSSGAKREADALMNYDGLSTKLSDIKHDVLIIVGSEDEMTTKDGSVATAEEIDTSWLVIVKGCSHRVWAEAPDICSRAIIEFIGM